MGGEGLESYPELLVGAAVAEQLSYAHKSLLGSNTVTSPSLLPLPVSLKSSSHESNWQLT